MVKMESSCRPDDKINVSERLKFVLGTIENIVIKGEHADYRQFLLVPQWSQKAFLPRSLKVGILVKG